MIFPTKYNYFQVRTESTISSYISRWKTASLLYKNIPYELITETRSIDMNKTYYKGKTTHTGKPIFLISYFYSTSLGKM